MMSLTILLPIVITLIILFTVLRPILRMRTMAKSIVQNGKAELGRVVSSSQTGLTVNGVPQIEVVLDLQVAGQPARRVSSKLMLGLGEIPGAGEMVYALVDQKDPNKFLIIPGRPQQASTPVPIQPDYPQPQPAQAYQPPSPTPQAPQSTSPFSSSSSPFSSSASPFDQGSSSPFGNQQSPSSQAQAPPQQKVYAQPGAPVLNAEQFKLDLFSLAPNLRANGLLAVATVLATGPASNQATHFDLDIDSIGNGKRRLGIDQVMYGPGYDVGDRVYLLVDPNDPNVVAVIPLSVCGYQKIPRGANRLDSLVLGPELLHKGSRARGTIVSAQEIPLHNANLAAQGMCRFQLEVRVEPEDGSPAYTGHEAVGFKDRERATRMATVGAVVAIRYDRNDPQSFSIDSEVMGYPDAYKPFVEGFRRQLNPDSMLS